MAVIDEQFRGLEDWTLKNVQTNRRQIGNGAYGSVEEVEMDGVVCVAKRIHSILVYSNDEGVKRTRERFVQECIIMSKLRHPHIVQFLGVFFPSPEDQRRERSFSISSLSGSYSHSQLGGGGGGGVGGPLSPPPINPTGLPWLIMEYLPYTLDHVLEKRPNIPMHVKVSLLLDITKGLLYLHNKEIYHRDLTARNVLITSSMVAKIADFGVARMFKTTVSNMAGALTTLPGNQLYMPPEADQERSGGTALYGNTIDIFSFGVIVLFTITQMFPCNLLPSTYPDPDRPGAVRGRTEVERRGKYFEIAEGNSKTDENQRLIKLSQHCLQNDPGSRPKAEVVLEELTYFEKTLANRRLNGSTEIWKKDKLQLVELLDEKQKSTQVQSPMENSKEVQRDSAHELIRLQNECRQLKEKSALEVEELRTVNTQLRADVTRTEHNLNIMTQDHEDLRREHENLQNVLRDRQSQLDRSKEENGVLSETIRDLQQVIRMLEDDKNNDIHSVPQLQREIQTLKEENGRLTREKEALSDRNNVLPSLSHEIERLYGELDRHKQIIKKMDEDMSCVGAETKQLRDRVKQLSDENERLFQDNERLQREVRRNFSRQQSHQANTFKPPPLPDSGIQVNLPIFWKDSGQSTYGLHGAQCVIYRKKLLYGGGEGKDDNRCKILEFDLTRFQWGEFSRFTQEQFAMAVVQGRLMLIGGFNSRQDEYSSRVCQWNEEGKYWSSINRDLPIARCDASAIGYGHKLIVAGGFNGEPLDNVCMLDLEYPGLWQNLCPLPSPAYALQSTWYFNSSSRHQHQKVALWYLLSSSRGSGISQSRPVYAVSLKQLVERHGQWSVIPDPPFADSGAVTMRGHLLAVGGRDKHTERKEIHMYFPGTSEWLNVASLEYPRHSVTCYPLSDKKFVVMGGRDESAEYSSKVDQYNMTLS